MNTLRILVVDDEVINREIIEEYFYDQPGYALTITEGGEDAWQALQSAERGFDIILLDRMMPGLDGIGLLRRMKADRRFSHIPVIMQTAAGEPEQIREGMEAGAYFYLTKPYRGDALLAIVHAAANMVGSRDALTQTFKDCVDAMSGLQVATFSFRTVDEANRLATLVSQAFPSPEAAVLGIAELLVNAVEHGNLGVSYEQKKQLKLNDCWREELDRLIALPEHKNKVARLQYYRDAGQICLKIYDEGNGFPWQNYLELSAERACDPNGRGIALAKMMSFTSISYEGCGNVAVAVLDLAAAQH